MTASTQEHGRGFQVSCTSVRPSRRGSFVSQARLLITSVPALCYYHLCYFNAPATGKLARVFGDTTTERGSEYAASSRGALVGRWVSSPCLLRENRPIPARRTHGMAGGTLWT